jgi:hypothetical protein
MTTPSPCVGICVLEDDVCIGCGRTVAEIYQAGIDAGAPPSKDDNEPPPRDERH